MFTQEQLQRASTGGLIALSLMLTVMVALVGGTNVYLAITSAEWWRLLWLVTCAGFAIMIYRMQCELGRRRGERRQSARQYPEPPTAATPRQPGAEAPGKGREI